MTNVEERASRAIPKGLEFRSLTTAYIDLLGFKRRLMQFESDVLGTSDRAQRVAATQRHVLPLLLMRAEAEETMRAFLNAPVDQAMLADLPPRARELFEAARAEAQCSTFWFGDTVTQTVPLSGVSSSSYLRSLYGVLGGVGLLWLRHLAIGLPIRGGVELGIGCLLPTGEPLGSSLVGAYELEAQASHPRILVGRKLTDALRSPSWPSEDPGESMVCAATAKHIDRLMRKDGDGHVFLHVLGDFFLDVLANARLTGIVSRGYAHAREQQSAYAGDEHVRRKYDWIISYFERTADTSPTLRRLID